MSRMRLAPFAVALAVVFTIAGCTTDDPTPTSTTTSASPTASVEPTIPVETPSESATPSASPSPSTSAAAGPACASLVTAQELYDYDSNYAPESIPEAGGGATICGWSSGSADTEITLTVLPGRAPSGTGVPGYDGTFSQGSANVTIGKWNVTVTSPRFTTVDDALPFLDLVAPDLR